jgi:hypothetical protein
MNLRLSDALVVSSLFNLVKYTARLFMLMPILMTFAVVLKLVPT